MFQQLAALLGVTKLQVKVRLYSVGLVCLHLLCLICCASTKCFVQGCCDTVKLLRIGSCAQDAS